VHTAVAALDLEPGREIITAPVTDLGTVIGIIYQGCVPVFADWRRGTINMDPAEVEKKINAKTSAVIVVHLAGQPCDMDAIKAVCRRHGLPLVEDCSQAYLAEYRGRMVGTIGRIGCFSMQQSKHLTAGEGGAVITNDADLAERMALFRDKGWERSHAGPRKYSMLGLNYRVNELTAAVALAQLDKLSRVVICRRKLCDFLSKLIKDIPGIAIPDIPAGAVSSYWFYPLFITGCDMRKFAAAMAAEGVAVGAGYTGKPIYLCSEVFTKKRTFGQSGYPFTSSAYGKSIEYREGLCPVAESALNQLVTIPILENWRREDIADIAAAIRKVAEALCVKR
jgi:dTDP-4-amino-4,6-dideoxygalactose transaminase